MSTLFRLAWRNMWRNWRRTAIGLTAIVLGLMLLLLLDGFIEGSNRAIFGNAVRLYGGNVMVHAPGYRERASRLPLLPLDEEDTSRVVLAAEALPEVEAVALRINTSGLASGSNGDSQPVMITGIEPEREAPVSIVAEGIAEGRFLLAEEGDAVVIGRGLANLLEVAVADRIDVVGRGRGEDLHQREMTVVGIYDLGMREAEEGLVFVTLNQAQTIYRLRDQATEVAITLTDIGKEGPSIEALQSDLAAYEVDGWDTLRPEIRQLMESKAGFTGFIGFVVLLIACIGVLNIMMMSVFERTHEMGILAALGMKSRQVMALFLIEGTMIGVIGAVLGCLLGAGLVWLIGLQGVDLSFVGDMGEIGSLMGSRLVPWVAPSTVIGRGLAVGLIAALSSIFPAWRASRLSPAEVLHHV
jgi:ABC-type lipoprotein release transport system permease subunit